MTDYKEPKIAYTRSGIARVARLSSGGLCIVVKNRSATAKHRWEAYQCEPVVLSLPTASGVAEHFVTQYRQLKGFGGELVYGRTQKGAVLDCLINFWA